MGRMEKRGVMNLLTGKPSQKKGFLVIKGEARLKRPNELAKKG